MIAALLTASRLCAAVSSMYGPGVTARDIDRTVPLERACRAAVIIVMVADEWRPELIAWRSDRFCAVAAAFTTNSPLDSHAGIESDVPVPGPVIWAV